MYKKQVPDGVEDCLPAECCIKKNIESSLRNEFILSGYEELETPAYEYIDAFQSGVGSYMQESMIKFVDSRGRILVLRPDITVPIARVAATKLKKGVKRLFYIQNSFAAASPSIGIAGEFTQAGIELIGDERFQADAEVISLAIQSLITAGLKSFTIDIGQVEFFKELISGLKLTEEQTDRLRHAVDSKDLPAIDAVTKEYGIPAPLKEQIKALPGLYGGQEVFDKAIKLSDNPGCRKAVENLRGVYGLLDAMGFAEYISIDFGMLHDIAYYSGIIFRGITPGIGFPVLSGGRYDGLLEKFGSNEAATGFALGIKRVMIAMERQGILGGNNDTYAAVSCDMKSCRAASEYVSKLRQEGKRAVFSSGLSIDELVGLKAVSKASCAFYFDADGNMESI